MEKQLATTVAKPNRQRQKFCISTRGIRWQHRRRFTKFCHVIDNFGDIGVCWRLACNLAQRGQTVRLAMLAIVNDKSRAHRNAQTSNIANFRVGPQGLEFHLSVN